MQRFVNRRAKVYLQMVNSLKSDIYSALKGLNAYNQPVVDTIFSTREQRNRQVTNRTGWILLLALIATIAAHAQVAAENSVSAESKGRILMVLPFDNHSGQPKLDWMREAASDLLSRRLTSAGFDPMSRTDRLYAFDHLGLPQEFQPSRASMLKMAQTLDADSIIVGNYRFDGTTLVAEARLVDVSHLHMSDAISAKGELKDMIAIFDSLAWKLTRQLDPKFSVAEETFVASGKNLRLDAFEQYIRGISEADTTERLRHLKKAVEISPTYSAAWMELGREEYKSQQYDDAAAAFAKVNRNDSDALEAGFYRGLSLIFSGDYPNADKSFAAVAGKLPLADVLNNQGVALARQGKDGSALFRQAEDADPTDADFHFNLAVSLKRLGNSAEALKELAQCLKLHPSDSEAQMLQAAWKVSVGEQGGGLSTRTDALERISRTFDEVAFRQAAQMLDQTENARLAALTPKQRAVKLAEQAREYLDHGLLLEAERIYISAVALDSKVAEAHAGLAEVKERTGDKLSARKEAQLSLELMPSATAYLVMSRLDLAAGQLDQASYEAEEALKLDATSNAAQELQKQIDAAKTQKK
jgi:tetratricopeptide (TPR) repeat protein